MELRVATTRTNPNLLENTLLAAKHSASFVCEEHTEDTVISGSPCTGPAVGDNHQVGGQSHNTRQSLEFEAKQTQANIRHKHHQKVKLQCKNLTDTHEAWLPKLFLENQPVPSNQVTS